LAIISLCRILQINAQYEGTVLISVFSTMTCKSFVAIVTTIKITDVNYNVMYLILNKVFEVDQSTICSNIMNAYDLVNF